MNTVAEIEALIAKDKPDYTTAYNKAVALAEYMKNAPGDDSNDAYDVATDAYTVEAGSQQALSGGNEGPASLAQEAMPAPTGTPPGAPTQCPPVPPGISST